MRPFPMTHRRAGTTLIEMMLSMVIMLIVIAAATSFFRVQARATDTGAGRLDAVHHSSRVVRQCPAVRPTHR